MESPAPTWSYPPRSRSKIIEWCCQELGVDYETIDIDMAKVEHKGPEFLKINPFGKLPVLEAVDGTNLIESGRWREEEEEEEEEEEGKRNILALSGQGLSSASLMLMVIGAILMYIVDKYGKLKTPEERAKVNQW